MTITTPLPPPVSYFPRPEGTFNLYKANAVFEHLWNDLNWVRVRGLPRKEYYTNTDSSAVYSYGRPEYAHAYHPQPETDVLTILRHGAEDLCKCSFEAMFLNGYENERDQLGWHADDSPEMDPARPIVIMTFGPKGEREIAFRDNEHKVVTKRLLEHGSILIMDAGMQQTHQHAIPKVGHAVGPRVSITMRGYLKATA